MAVVPSLDTQWDVVLINAGSEDLLNVLVVSNGYGKDEKGNEINTGTLRFLYEKISPKEIQNVEKIDPSVFKLSNEYWISYWIDQKMYDRRFVFMPDSIDLKNCVFIKMLDKEAVLHA